MVYVLQSWGFRSFWDFPSAVQIKLGGKKTPECSLVWFKNGSVLLCLCNLAKCVLQWHTIRCTHMHAHTHGLPDDAAYKQRWCGCRKVYCCLHSSWGNGVLVSGCDPGIVYCASWTHTSDRKDTEISDKDCKSDSYIKPCLMYNSRMVSKSSVWK